MKILIFWEQDYYGGVDKHLIELLKTWPNKSDQITVLTNEENEAASSFTKKNGFLHKKLKVVKFKSFSHNIINFKLRKFKILQYFLYPLLPLLFFLNLNLIKKLLNNFKDHEIIISNNGGYPASWNCIASIIAAKKIGITKRFLLIHHESSDFFFLLKWFHKKVDKLLSNSVSKIICVSKSTKNSFLKKRFVKVKQTKIKVIYNTLEIKKPKKNFNLRTRFKINKKKMIIGVISRIEPYKGHMEFINSISKIDKSHLDKIHVLIVGKGYGNFQKILRNKVKKLNLEDKITFTGFMPEASENIISQFDLLVNPTQTFEGYGLSILEAINLKIPVIATKVGAIEEVFGERNINIISNKNINAMSLKIKMFINDNNFFKKKAYSAFKFFSSNYRPMSKEYRNLLLKN